MKRKIITILPGLSLLLFLPYQSLAGDITYLPKVTKEELHNILDPSGDPPDPPKRVSEPTRGLEQVKPGTAAPVHRSCDFKGRGLVKVGNTEGVKEEVKSVGFPVLFEFGKATLTPEAETTLDTVADALKEGKLAESCFLVEGHTDNVGSAKSNLALSKQRAESVKAYLKKKGVDGDRLTADGYGFTKPIADNKTPEGQQKNRRAQLANLGYAQAQ